MIPQEVFKYIERKLGRFILVVLLLCVLFVWLSVRIVHADRDDLLVYFLPVGQGDGELVALPGGVTILIDGGPLTLDAVRALDTVLPGGVRTIDVVVLTHPQLDHYGGLLDVTKRYKVGAFITNGISNPEASFGELSRILSEQKISAVTFRAGDRVRYGSGVLCALAPQETGSVADQNAVVLVFELLSKNTKMLFMSDASAETERAVGEYAGKIDVLKVSHHGSKYSSGEEFIRTVSPKIAVIEVGKNTYGHPAPQTLARFEAIGAKMFRTDTDGLITIKSDGKSLTVLK